jgi:hypothetical protein
MANRKRRSGRRIRRVNKKERVKRTGRRATRKGQGRDKTSLKKKKKK